MNTWGNVSVGCHQNCPRDSLRAAHFVEAVPPKWSVWAFKLLS